jgi:hypothetical protein
MHFRQCTQQNPEGRDWILTRLLSATVLKLCMNLSIDAQILARDFLLFELLCMKHRPTWVVA